MEPSLSYALDKVGRPNIALKPEQRECIEHIYVGKDVFVWLPTGFGKSLCYEVLPFVFDYKLGRQDSLVIVVSPLISLMADQVMGLRRRSVDAAIMSSSGNKDLMAIEEEIMNYRLLFCAPEAIDSPQWRSVIAKREVSSRVVTLVVDEAHCVSKW